MLALAHFAIGFAGGLVLLMLYPSIIPSVLKNDIFFAFLSGIWAMVPDLNKFIPAFNSLHKSSFANIFWFHHYMDNFADTIHNVFWCLVILTLTLLIYYKKIN